MVTTTERCELENVIAEVDVSDQYTVDPETGKALDYIHTTQSDAETVGKGYKNDTWRYYCPHCGQRTQRWTDILKTHEA